MSRKSAVQWGANPGWLGARFDVLTHRLRRADRSFPGRLRAHVAHELGLRPDEVTRWRRGLERGIVLNELPRVWANTPGADARSVAIVARADRKRFAARLANASNLLLVTGHAGPRFVVVDLLRAVRPDAVVISANPEHWSDDERREVDARSMSASETLRLQYLRAFTVLRDGGVAYAAPDGGLGEGLEDATVLGVPVQLSRAVAALAAQAKATSVPVACSWRGCSVALRIGEPLSPDGALARAEWERQWVDDYAAWLDEIYRSGPTSWRLPTGVTESFFEPDDALIEWHHAYNRRVNELRR